MGKIISKHLIEIRYKPNSRFLDKRGELADNLSGGIFDQWTISANRIDFSKKGDENIGAFISYRNLGFFTNYPNAQNLFVEKTKEFIRTAWQHFPTGKITRIGIRSTYLSEAKDFKTVFDNLKNKFLAFSNDELKQFNGDLIDFAFPLNFVAGEDFFNVNAGPMEKTQSKEILAGEFEELPEAGLYVDLDYFRKEFTPYITQKQVFEFIDKGIKKGEEINKLLADWATK